MKKPERLVFNRQTITEALANENNLILGRAPWHEAAAEEIWDLVTRQHSEGGTPPSVDEILTIINNHSHHQQ